MRNLIIFIFSILSSFLSCSQTIYSVNKITKYCIDGEVLAGVDETVFVRDPSKAKIKESRVFIGYQSQADDVVELFRILMDMNKYVHVIPEKTNFNLLDKENTKPSFEFVLNKLGNSLSYLFINEKDSIYMINQLDSLMSKCISNYDQNSTSFYIRLEFPRFNRNKKLPKNIKQTNYDFCLVPFLKDQKAYIRIFDFRKIDNINTFYVMDRTATAFAHLSVPNARSEDVQRLYNEAYKKFNEAIEKTEAIIDHEIKSKNFSPALIEFRK